MMNNIYRKFWYSNNQFERPTYFIVY